MQKGQALIEAMVLMIILASLFVAIIWLNQLQDIGLQLNHASRHQAFKLAYQKQEPNSADSLDAYIRPSNWSDRQGQSRINNFELKIGKSPIGAYSGAEKNFDWFLFDELKLGNESIWRVTASSHTGDSSEDSTSIAGFDRRYLLLSRTTAIMQAAKSIASDSQVQANLAGSDSVWANRYSDSADVGKKATDRLLGVDKAWGRPLPGWNWLDPWASSLPKRHLSGRIGAAYED